MLKKLVYFICIMTFSISVKAISPVVDYESGTGIYSNRQGNKLYSGQMALIFMDNHIAYCLEPYELVGKTYYEDLEYKNSIGPEDLEYYELVAYYGYNTTTRNNIYYYMAAQELIWERMIGSGNISFSTGINSTGSVIDISEHKNEILTDINNFYTNTSFNNEIYGLDYFEEIRLLDNNNVINNYESRFNGISNFKKIDNGFTIKMKDSGKKNIELIRNIKTENNTTIYTGKGNQTLGVFGVNKTINNQFYIESKDYRTNLILTFYDKETKKLIKNVNFDICMNDEKIVNDWTHTDRYIYNLKISEGIYKVCRLNSEYILTDDLIFKIDKDQLLEDTYVDLYLTKVKKDDEQKGNIDESDPNGVIEIEKNYDNEYHNELPNTSNYYFDICLLLFLMFIFGVVIYAKDNRS